MPSAVKQLHLRVSRNPRIEHRLQIFSRRIIATHEPHLRNNTRTVNSLVKCHSLSHIQTLRFLHKKGDPLLRSDQLRIRMQSRGQTHINPIQFLFLEHLAVICISRFRAPHLCLLRNNALIHIAKCLQHHLALFDQLGQGWQMCILRNMAQTNHTHANGFHILSPSISAINSRDNRPPSDTRTQSSNSSTSDTPHSNIDTRLSDNK